MTALAILLGVLILILVFTVNKFTKDFFNPYAIMCYIWITFIIGANLFDVYVGYYEMRISSIMLCYTFLLIIGLSYYVLLKLFDRSKAINYSRDLKDHSTYLNKEKILKIANIFFVWFIATNILYWINVFKIISIGEILRNPGYFKYLVLNDIINDNSIIYLGRNFSIIGATLTLAYFLSNKSKKNLFMLITYIILALVDIRREPMIIKLTGIMLIILLNSKKKIHKSIKQLLLIGSIFLIVFFTTTTMLNPDGNMNRIIFSYTVGAFPSLQALIDNPPVLTNLPLAHTFYFVYAFLKFIDPRLTPPSVVLPTISTKSTNVYTALSYVVMDSRGNYLTMYLILIIYGIFVGTIFAVSTYMFNKKITFLSLSIYLTAGTLAIRSFMNPAFSHLDMIFSIFYGVILVAMFRIDKQPKRSK